MTASVARNQWGKVLYKASIFHYFPWNLHDLLSERMLIRYCCCGQSEKYLSSSSSSYAQTQLHVRGDIEVGQSLIVWHCLEMLSARNNHQVKTLLRHPLLCCRNLDATSSQSSSSVNVGNLQWTSLSDLHVIGQGLGCKQRRLAVLCSLLYGGQEDDLSMNISKTNLESCCLFGGSDSSSANLAFKSPTVLPRLAISTSRTWPFSFS